MKKKKKRSKVIPLPEFIVYEGATYSEITAMDLFNHIHTNFHSAQVYLKRTGKKNADLREVLVRWGVWSRRMNTIIRARINKPIPQEYLYKKEDEKENKQQELKVLQYQHQIMQLKLAYGYWWNRTHKLETYRKSFFGRFADHNSFDQGEKAIKNMIINNVGIEQIKSNAPSFWNMIEKLATKKELTAEETESVLDGSGGPVNTLG